MAYAQRRQTTVARGKQERRRTLNSTGGAKLVAMNEILLTSFELYEDQQAWLTKMQEEFGLPNASKTLRVLIEFARATAEPDTIFNDIRCTRC